MLERLLDGIFKPSWPRKLDKLEANAPAEIKAFYESLPREFNRPISTYKIAALDLETTGLDAKKDEILSFGCVDLSQQQIDLSSCFYDLVKPKQQVSEASVLIHGITHDEFLQAGELEQRLTFWLQRLEGRVLLAHHSRIEFSFLQAACKQIYNYDFCMPYLDTLGLEQAYLERQQGVIKNGELRIDPCRKRHGLPRSTAHHALNDAIACGELFLAITSKRYAKAELKQIIAY